MKPKYLPHWAPLSLIIIIAIGTGVLDYFTPLMGDDMSKWLAMGGDDSAFPDRRAISFLAAQYFGCNGRIFDALGPLITNLLPHVLASALIGFMTGLFFYALCLSAGVLREGRATLACGLIAVALFTLPWWDSMFMRVCHFNYIWATTFALFFVHAWFSELNPGKWTLFGLFILGGMAGCFHEQIGVAMTAYFGLYVIIKRCWDWHLVPFAGLCIGTLLTIASPAIWIRNSEFIQDATRVEMLYTTLPWVIIALVVIAIISLTHNKLQALLGGDKLRAYIIIAVFSSAIALYSTTPGRTGWLPESFALVVLAMLCEGLNVNLKRGVSVMLISLCVLSTSAHFAVSICWQKKMYREYEHAIGLYRESTDGIVRMEYTDRFDVSPLTLYRVKGLPDVDDTHLLRVFSNHYGHGEPLFLIDSKCDVSASLPENYSLIYNTISDTLMVVQTASGQTIISPFLENGVTLYRLEPMVVDPGDHWHPVE